MFEDLVEVVVVILNFIILVGRITLKEKSTRKVKNAFAKKTKRIRAQ